jgi:hypothetical protein
VAPTAWHPQCGTQVAAGWDVRFTRRVCLLSKLRVPRSFGPVPCGIGPFFRLPPLPHARTTAPCPASITRSTLSARTVSPRRPFIVQMPEMCTPILTACMPSTWYSKTEGGLEMGSIN